MAEMLERVMELENRFDTFEADLGGVRESVVRIDNGLVHLEERIDRRFEAIDRRFEAFERRFENLETHMVNGFAEIRMTQRSDLRWILSGVAGSAAAVILAMFGMMFAR